MPTTGATAPLWALVLALVHALVPASAGVDGVVRGTLAVGALLHLAVIAVIGDAAARITRSENAAAVGGLLVALATPFALAAFSGMEVGLAALTLSLGVRALIQGHPGRAGIWLGLAGAARPESAAVILVGLLWALREVTPSLRPRTAARFLAGPLLVGAAFVGYDLWASGAALPAAFYAKSSGSLLSLPGRIGRAVGGIFVQVPPFAAGLGWLALLGLIPRISGRLPAPTSRMQLLLPALGGTAFVLANVALIDPRDPAAFYHVRYLLPAVPLLLLALTGGAWAMGLRFVAGPRAVPAWTPLAVLLGIAVIAGGAGASTASRHFHNDVRNVNEVQRLLGERLRESLPAGTRIATSDAGAVRYFSNLPTIDVTGLNTPEMRAPSAEFLQRHPVAAIVLLPAWYRSPDADRLQEMFRAITADYTVTSDERMAAQVVLGVRAPDDGRTDPVRIRFVGFHSFALDFVPPAAPPGNAR
ncbi:MAG: hypothetical protein DHS20C21_03320 [Gemmatimonadota bacterium]|nr:MAG: hypothetical protein DHS20C21_03320 [Gemmatimonadota bacterium]